MSLIKNNCCASFFPNTAWLGFIKSNSLFTTVKTPSKWPGLEAPSRIDPTLLGAIEGTPSLG